MKILVIDSGIGGLTVASLIYKNFDNISIDYLADSKYAPYGEKSAIDIIKRGRKIAEYIKNKDYNLVVVACNTLSILALNEIKSATDANIINVFDSTKKILNDMKNNNCIVLGSGNTIRSGFYEDALRDKNNEVLSVDATKLVYAVENSDFNLVKLYMKDLSNKHNLKNFNTLILGCTHFPLIENEILNWFNPSVKIISSSKAGANDATCYIKNNVGFSNKKKFTIYTTGDKESFSNQVKLNDKFDFIDKITKIKI